MNFVTKNLLVIYISPSPNILTMKGQERKGEPDILVLLLNRKILIISFHLHLEPFHISDASNSHYHEICRVPCSISSNLGPTVDGGGEV